MKVQTRHAWTLLLVVVAIIAVSFCFRSERATRVVGRQRAAVTSQQSTETVERSSPIARARPLSTGIEKANARPVVSQAQPAENADEPWLPRAPSGRPLAEIRNDLQRRADAGDAAAASELYRDLFTCDAIRTTLANAKGIPKALIPDGRSIGELEPDVREFVLGEMTRRQPAMDFANANAGFCAGIKEPIDDRSKYSAALQAAKLGDEGAAVCYVASAITYLIGEPETFDVVGGPAPDNPVDPVIVAAYRENALALAELGIQLGDWRMVSTLQSIYSNSSWLYSFRLAQPDLAKSYAYGKLLHLGQTAASSLQRGGDAAPLHSTGDPLSEQEKAEADRWAMETYQRYFANSPPPQANWTMCDLR